jgi:hypothetical protein
MIGEAGREGISALTMIDLLGRAGELRRYKNVIIRVAYIEIYNENIKDLLISEGTAIANKTKISTCGKTQRKACLSPALLKSP